MGSKRMLDRHELKLCDQWFVEWIDACQEDVDWAVWAVSLRFEGEPDDELIEVGPAFCDTLDAGLQSIYRYASEWPEEWLRVPKSVKAIFTAQRIMAQQFIRDLPPRTRRPRRNELFCQKFGVLAGGLPVPADPITIGEKRRALA